MSKYKVNSTNPTLPSDLEELLRQLESEKMIHDFAKDLVRGHYEEQWKEVSV